MAPSAGLVVAGGERSGCPARGRQEPGGRTLAVRITVADGVTTIGLDQGAVDLDQVQVPVADLVMALGSGTLDEDTIGNPVWGSVGSRHLLVSLPSVADVDSVRPDGASMRTVLAHAGAQGCYAYTTATDAPPMPADAYAVLQSHGRHRGGPGHREHSGAARGLLGGRPDRGFTVAQGVRMGRPSSLQVTVRKDGTTLSGRCALSATGRLTT